MDSVQNLRYSPEEILLHALKKRRSATGDLADAVRLQDEIEHDAQGKEENEEEADDDDDDDEAEADEGLRSNVSHGCHMVRGKMGHGMEDYVVAETRKIDGHDVGLYAIFDGHSGRDVAEYLQRHLFDNILNQPDFWKNPRKAIRRAYKTTDKHVLENVVPYRGGSTAVTAILVDGKKLVIANIGDSRAILCRKGRSKQITVDHEPEREKHLVESKGGFVSKKPGNVPRVDGQLAMTRAFGDGRLKDHITAEPDIRMEVVDKDTQFIILASDGLWKVMSNEEALDCVEEMTDAEAAAKELINEALARDSKDDISCVVVAFH